METNIDYKALYEGARERIKKYVLDEHGCTRLRPEDIFPDLKESEDERMRKQCIQLLKDAYSTRHDAIECIAYLERQKDLFKEGRGLYMYDGENVVLMCAAPVENPYDFAISLQEGQKEQKPSDLPADKDFPPLEGIDAIKAEYYDKGFKAGFDRCVDSIKPAEWSEEDDQHVASLLARLHGMCEKGATFTRTRFAISEDKDWLKSLRPQPKQEWSEEDKKKKERIIKILEQANENWRIAQGSVPFGELITWLKSLRPHPKKELDKEDETRRTNAIILLQTPILRKVYQQGEIDKAVEWLRNLRPNPHWKPSEEQMEALRHYVETTTDGELDLLYNDLLKLK